MKSRKCSNSEVKNAHEYEEIQQSSASPNSIRDKCACMARQIYHRSRIMQVRVSVFTQHTETKVSNPNGPTNCVNEIIYQNSINAAWPPTTKHHQRGILHCIAALLPFVFVFFQHRVRLIGRRIDPVKEREKGKEGNIQHGQKGEINTQYSIHHQTDTNS